MTKEYNKNHKEEIKEYSKEYRKNHREEKKEYSKEYYKNHKEEIKEHNLKKLYNISLDDFNNILHKQNHKCQICKKSFTKKNKICVDHDHKTKKVRGLLCHSCNVSIGHFREDTQIMRNATNYIKKWKK